MRIHLSAAPRKFLLPLLFVFSIAPWVLPWHLFPAWEFIHLFRALVLFSCLSAIAIIGKLYVSPRLLRYYVILFAFAGWGVIHLLLGMGGPDQWHYQIQIFVFWFIAPALITQILAYSHYDVDRIIYAGVFVAAALFGLILLDGQYGDGVRRVVLENHGTGTINLTRMAGLGVVSVVGLVLIALTERRRLVLFVMLGLLGPALLSLLWGGTRSVALGVVLAVFFLLVSGVTNLGGRIRIGSIFWGALWAFLIVVGAYLFVQYWAEGARVFRYLSWGALAADENVISRLDIWSSSLRAFAENGFLGLGPDGARLSAGISNYPHNVVLEGFVNFGVVGGGLVVAIVVIPVVSYLYFRMSLLHWRISKRWSWSRARYLRRCDVVFGVYLVYLVSSMLSSNLSYNYFVPILGALLVGLSSIRAYEEWSKFHEA